MSFVPLFLYVRWALGATAVWTNGGGDGLWSNCANWSGGTGTGGCPGVNDVATFNSTSVADAHVDTNISVSGINIASTYSGNVIQDSTKTITVGSNGFTQAAGTFTGGDSAITLNNTSGSFNLTGGIFNNTSATMSILKNMTVNGGTFNNSGTVKFNSSSNTNSQTLTCSSSLPGTFDVAQATFNNQTFTLSSGCTITFATTVTTFGSITNNGTINATNINMTGQNFTQNGTLNITGTLKFNSSSSSGTNQILTCTGNLTNSGGVVDIAQGTYNTLTFTLSSGCIVNLSASVTTSGSIANNGTMNATNITLQRNFTQSGTLSLTGTLKFNLGSAVTDDQTLNCTGNLTDSGGVVDIAQVTYHTLYFTLGSGCIATLASSISTPGSIINNGTMNATNITLERNFTQNGTLNLTGTMTFSASNSSYTDQTLTCSGNLTNSGGLVNITQATYNTLTFTLSSNCAVNLSTPISTVGSIINNGTMVGTNVSTQSNFTQNGTFTLSGTLTFSGTTNSSTLSCTNPVNANVTLNKTSTGTLTAGSNCTITGNFTRTDGQIADSSSNYTLSVQGNMSIAQTDAVGGTHLTIAFTGGSDQTLTDSSVPITSSITVNKTAGTITLANTITDLGSCTITAGTLYLSGYDLSCSTGLTVQGRGTLKMQGSEFTPSPTLSTGSTVMYVGDGDSAADSYTIKNWPYSNLTVNMTDSTDTLTGYNSSNTLATGLKANWKMDEANSTDPVVDSSGNVSDGTATGTSIISGHVNNARNFVSTNSDFITIPSDTDLDMNASSVTISMWIRTSSSYGAERLLFEHNIWAATGTYQLTTPSSTSFKFNFPGAGTVPIYSVNFADGNWHQLAATFDDTNNLIKLFFDGVFVLSGAETSSIGSSGLVASYIGARGGTTFFFNGDIDESKVYNRALTASEINDIYNNVSDNSFSSLTVSGNFTLSGGIFSAPTTLNVAGNFSHTGGTFTTNNGLVNLNGTNQKLYGDTTFYDLTKSASNDTLTFESGKTQTVTHTATLTGTSGAPLRLFATSPGTQAKFDPQGTRTFSYLNVKDNNNTNATIISTSGLNINNVGDNTNWDFSGRPTANFHVLGTHFGSGSHITTH